MTLRHWLLRATLFVTALAVPAGAQTPRSTGYVETFANGGIDWTEGGIWADGYGLYPEKAHSRGQARLMARRAAMVDAYRSLAEVINGVRVDAQSTMKDFVVQDDTVRTQVDALIKGAQVLLDESTTDGYHVRLGIGMFGRSGLARIVPVKSRRPDPARASSLTVRHTPTIADVGGTPVLAETGGGKGVLVAPSSQTRATDARAGEGASRPVATPASSVTTSAGADSPGPTPAGPRTEAVAPSATTPSIELRRPKPPFGLPQVATGPYTGLLVDARGTNAKPCMSPRVISADGSEVYGTMTLSREQVLSEGIVGWVRADADVEGRALRCGDRPLIVRAVAARGPLHGDLVIESEDAERALAADAKYDFLAERRVVIALP